MLLLLLLLQPLTVLSCSWLDATGFSRGTMPPVCSLQPLLLRGTATGLLTQRPAPLAMSRLRSPEGSRGPYGPFKKNGNGNPSHHMNGHNIAVAQTFLGKGASQASSSSSFFMICGHLSCKKAKRQESNFSSRGCRPSARRFFADRCSGS